MRKRIKQFVKITATELPFSEPVVEFGALQVPGQIGFADLRPFFAGREFVGADMRNGPGVDKILDLHSIDLPSESVGSVLCIDTLEHVEFPHQAMKEIYRILSPEKGIAVITSVMQYKIHDYPFDYWRFTPTAFESLLKPFQNTFVGYAGKKEFPHTVVGIGFKGDVPDLSAFIKKYDYWRKLQRFDFKQIVRNIAPPALIPMLSYISSTAKRKKNVFGRLSRHD